jgi:MFS family permease
MEPEMHHLFSDIGNAALWGGGGLLVILAVQYAVLAHWFGRGRARPDLIGVSITGLALGIVIIYGPSLAAAVDPAALAGFASSNWYFWLAVGTVIWVAVFAAVLVIAWERVRQARRRLARTTASEQETLL